MTPPVQDVGPFVSRHEVRLYQALGIIRTEARAWARPPGTCGPMYEVPVRVPPGPVGGGLTNVPLRILPNPDGSCPASAPIKVSQARIYYLPQNDANYDRTHARSCLVTVAVAQAAGYRGVKWFWQVNRSFVTERKP